MDQSPCSSSVTPNQPNFYLATTPLSSCSSPHSPSYPLHPFNTRSLQQHSPQSNLPHISTENSGLVSTSTSPSTSSPSSSSNIQHPDNSCYSPVDNFYNEHPMPSNMFYGSASPHHQDSTYQQAMYQNPHTINNNHHNQHFHSNNPSNNSSSQHLTLPPIPHYPNLNGHSGASSSAGICNNNLKQMPPQIQQQPQISTQQPPQQQYPFPGGSNSFQNQLHQILDTKLTNFWSTQIKEIKKSDDFKNHDLPLARIKKIMKSDPNVNKISSETPILFAKACELFILESTYRAWVHTEMNKRRTLQRTDIINALTRCETFDFLVDTIPREDVKPSRRFFEEYIKTQQNPSSINGNGYPQNSPMLTSPLQQPPNAQTPEFLQYQNLQYNYNQKMLRQPGFEISIKSKDMASPSMSNTPPYYPSPLQNGNNHQLQLQQQLILQQQQQHHTGIKRSYSVDMIENPNNHTSPTKKRSNSHDFDLQNYENINNGMHQNGNTSHSSSFDSSDHSLTQIPNNVILQTTSSTPSEQNSASPTDLSSSSSHVFYYSD